MVIVMSAIGTIFHQIHTALYVAALKRTMPMKDEQEIEDKIQSKGLNAPRLAPANIDAVIASESFTVLPSGKVIVCELTLINGFSVRGEAATVSKENFNHEIGRRIARDNARQKIWELEGYLLQQKLFEARATNVTA